MREFSTNQDGDKFLFTAKLFLISIGFTITMSGFVWMTNMSQIIKLISISLFFIER